MPRRLGLARTHCESLRRSRQRSLERAGHRALPANLQSSAAHLADGALPAPAVQLGSEPPLRPHRGEYECPSAAQAPSLRSEALAPPRLRFAALARFARDPKAEERPGAYRGMGDDLAVPSALSVSADSQRRIV